MATPTANEPRINDRIRAREVLLIGADGEKMGVRALPEALHIAREADLDLVEVAPARDNGTPPVCRIMDYGKWKFDEAQRAKESRRKTTNVTIKEMKYRPKIAGGDFDTKTRKVAEFLNEGHKVKVTIMFRFRETQHPEFGRRILDRIAEQVGEFAKVESAPKLDGRNMVMVLAPDKRAQAAAAKPPKPQGEAAVAVTPDPQPNGAAPADTRTAEAAAAPEAASEDETATPASETEANPTAAPAPDAEVAGEAVIKSSVEDAQVAEA